MLVAGIAAVPVLQSKARYDNYKVFRFVPKDEKELEMIKNLETTFPGVKLWS